MSKQRTDSRILGILSADQLTAVVRHILADGLPNDSARRAFLTRLRRNAGKLLSNYLTEEEQLRRDGQRSDEPKHMPVATVLTLERQADGSWEGWCVCNGVTSHRKSKGLMGLTSALCRAWLKEAGIVTAKPSEVERP